MCIHGLFFFFNRLCHPFIFSLQVSSMMAPCVIRVDSSQFLASVGSVQNALIMICVLFVIMQTNTTCDTVSIELPFLEAKGNISFFYWWTVFSVIYALDIEIIKFSLVWHELKWGWEDCVCKFTKLCSLKLRIWNHSFYPSPNLWNHSQLE